MRVSTEAEPVLEMQSGRGSQVRRAKIKLYKAVDVMGWRAIGNKLADYSKSDQMNWIELPPMQAQQNLFEESD